MVHVIFTGEVVNVKLPANKLQTSTGNSYSGNGRPSLTSVGSFHSSRRGSDESMEDAPAQQSMSFRDLRVCVMYAHFEVSK